MKRELYEVPLFDLTEIAVEGGFSLSEDNPWNDGTNGSDDLLLGYDNDSEFA